VGGIGWPQGRAGCDWEHYFRAVGKLTSQIPSVSACSSVKHLKKVVGDSARIQNYIFVKNRMMHLEVPLESQRVSRDDELINISH